MSEILADSPLRRAPQMIAVPVEQRAQAKRLGTPEVRTLLGYTRRVLRLRDGHTLVVFSFSSAAPANWMFLIDSRNLTARRIPIPNNDFASHGAALGRDGDIYIMPYGNGRAYRYRVGEDRFEPIATGLPEGEYTWEAFGAANGRIYFGTYPNAYLGEYDPATGRCELWRQVVPEVKYVIGFAEDTPGQIRFKGWGPGEVWQMFDSQTRRFSPSEPPSAPAFAPLPAPPRDDTGFAQQVTTGTRRFALSVPSGRLWEVLPSGRTKLCGDPRSPAEPWYLEAAGDSVVGISHYGALFRYDLKTGVYQRGQLDNRAPAGNAIMFLETITPRCLIGANYSQQNLFRIDPQTGKIQAAEQMIARVTGEPMCAVGFGGRGYLGIYVQSLLSVYDPKRPFAAGKNPREIAELHSRYKQTRPRAAVTDGQLVYISSDSDYGHLGGALAVIDPQTEQVMVYPQLIRDQNLPTLAWDARNRLLWGGTDRWGQMRSHPPTQESSLLYAFDPKTRKVVATLIPWPGADTTNVLGCSANGILIASSGNELALIDAISREVLWKGTLPVGAPGRIRFSRDGHGYTLANGTLYRWDFTRNALTPIAETPGCAYLTEVKPGIWAAANTASVYRIDLIAPVATK